MRINLPVTRNNYELHPGDALVSTTDLRGQITYCNPPFVTVSGFERHELIGSPHNLIRHPDMPREAFRDMWETLKAGRPWTALVKNRRKNGDHYWVRANVTPVVTAGGDITGYMSVRTWASPAEIAEVAAIYARMVDAERADQPLPLRLREGRIERPGAVRALVRRVVGSTALRILLGMAAIVALPLVVARSPWTAAYADWLVPLAVVLEAVGGLALYRTSVQRTLEDLVANARAVAAGDLSRPMFSRDSFLARAVGRELTQLSVNLQAVVGDVRQEVACFGGTARDISGSVSDLAERTESQAASLEEAAATMEEFTATLQQNRERSREASHTVGTAAEAAGQGRIAIEGVRTAMAAIHKSSDDIGEITALVDELAFQTNLLALNAAVEAARAGEHGRGFAVVAGEVRQLAQRSAGAARDIRRLIATASEHVQQGRRSVEHADEQVGSIVEAVARTRTLVDEIHASADEQSSAIGQINDTIANLDVVTQCNAAMASEIRASAGGLLDQSRVLGEAVSVFRVAGKEATPSGSTARPRAAAVDASPRERPPHVPKAADRPRPLPSAQRQR
ncbi:methyl-accepting chemotaxis protein [Dyella lutea]|uniref:Methyl-accepting chemotaxis protein n=1 Tax=Dyella lutea TaxID=2950441 RepID=A0ABT1F922_9GAMM|nr:PAS domain-containing methyl-accepting chemotaxis protein [Dyella lutea]MCP1372943.1 methyl-accepting chemotaxis protein [Dyella lutea]